MMRSVIPWRARAATWLVLPFCALLVLYVAWEDPADGARGYWTGVTSSATSLVLFSCTFASLCTALDAGRLRSGGIWRRPLVRSELRVLLASTWPSILAACAIQTLGFLLLAPGTWGSPEEFPLGVPIAWAAMILCHAGLGTLLGTLLKPVLAAPSALLLSYVWLGFPWAVSYMPLRYLSGLSIGQCCAPYSTLAPAAITAVVVFSLGVVAGVVLVLSQLSRSLSRRLAAAGLAVVLAGAAAAAGLYAARDLGPYPNPPRAEEELVCTQQDTAESCLYPAQRWSANFDVDATIDSTVRRLADAGFDVPSRVTAAQHPASTDALRVIVRSDLTEADVRHSMSSDLSEPNARFQCSQTDEQQLERWTVISHAVEMVAEHFATAGEFDLPEETRGSPRLEEAVATARHLIDAPTPERREWISTARATLTDCSATPPELPTAS